ncbi:MAG TPA: glycosyltransferase family 4 protein [Atribacterota bacterium]|nr:glycosyltransferase family 4 protein [Atribacterota bacterium]
MNDVMQLQNKKKIAFYISTIRGGGAAKVMVNLANRFVTGNYDVSFITNFSASHEYELDDRIKRINLESKESEKGFLIKNLERCITLRRILKEMLPYVLISFMGENNFRALLASCFLKTHVIISVRNDPNKEYETKLLQLLAKCMYRIADGCVFQTSDAQAWFPKNIQKKSRIILNQVDKKFYETLLKPVRKNIITCGRLSAQKNQILLINAFAKIAKKYPDENLIIYGEGVLKDKLQNFIDELDLSNRVILAGATDNVNGVLSVARAFVLSSDYEGMPNALMEAMAMGLPVIATDCPCGGPKMLIKNGENGLLVPVNDVESLTESIKLVITNSELSEKMAANAKKTAELFEPDRVFNYWKSYLDKI